ncbi:MAG: NAD(P)-binding protein [Arhodomonas sp.]|nr:NAD(P)-binding protein [Arhodomonas sp.]
MEGFDALIIGSGAGGAACAWGLIQRGWRVRVLEAGPGFDAGDYALDRPDWEQIRFPHRPGSQVAYTFAPLQELDPAFDGLRSWSRTDDAGHRWQRRIGGRYHHVQGVGGSTLHFTGESHRLNPRGMRLRNDFGVGADWPFRADALLPYYETAEEVIGVAGPEVERRVERHRPLPQPPHRLSHASQRLASGAAALGMEWGANSVAALSRPRPGRPACNYCGGCNYGCPIRDKGSADVTFLREAAATDRFAIEPRTRVLRLEVDGRDRVAAVICASGDGERRIALQGRACWPAVPLRRRACYWHRPSPAPRRGLPTSPGRWAEISWKPSLG